MADVTIHGFPQSTFVRTARMVCEEKGVEYDVEPLEFGSAAHLALHPFAKIPAFSHGDVTLYETLAIAVYVDMAFDGPALQPKDAATKAGMVQWLSAFNDYGYDALIRGLVIPRLVQPSRGEEPDEAAIKATLPRIERFLEVADEALAKSDFLAGDALSFADLMLVPCVFYLSLTPEGEALLAKYGAVAAWLERMMARPSFAATMPPPPKQEAAA
jgi:glutathione S-transferase